MPMYPCTKCLENDWTHELADRATVRSTCKHCGYEVEFPARKQGGGKEKHHKPRKPQQTRIPYDPATSTFDPTQVGDGEVPW